MGESIQMVFNYFMQTYKISLLKLFNFFAYDYVIDINNSPFDILVASRPTCVTNHAIKCCEYRYL